MRRIGRTLARNQRFCSIKGLTEGNSARSTFKSAQKSISMARISPLSTIQINSTQSISSDIQNEGLAHLFDEEFLEESVDEEDIDR